MTGLILASNSASRAAILSSAGVPFEVIGSGVNETTVKRRLLAAAANPRDVARRLADAKAVAVSKRRPRHIVIGADQTLDVDGALFDKAGSLTEARVRLQALRGRSHLLHSAMSAARGGAVFWRFVESPMLTMRDFSDDYLDSYLARVAETLLDSVGCYQLEGEGSQLFQRIDGDYFAILGLPLLPLLAFLRGEGIVAA